MRGRLAGLYRDMGHAGMAYGVGWPWMIRRLRGPLRARGFEGREAVAWGLLDPKIPESALQVTITNHRLNGLQHRVNPVSLVALTEHKMVFYAYCQARGLPVPRFYGLSSRPVGYAADGRALVTADDWRALAVTLPDEFVVKPSQGVYGRGFRIFRREGNGFADSGGGRCRPEDLGAATMTDPAFGSFVIQERLTDHPELARLSGVSNLQTVRLVTWVRENGEVTIPHAVFKVLAGDSVVDNYDHGRTGNLLSICDPVKGTLEGGIGPSPGNALPRIWPAHPRTGVPFAGFTLPLWEEACALVRRGAIAFLPMRAVGWDVGLTAAGPIIMEGNMCWDPFNYVAHSTREEVLRPAIEFLRELEETASRVRLPIHPYP